MRNSAKILSYAAGVSSESKDLIHPIHSKQLPYLVAATITRDNVNEIHIEMDKNGYFRNIYFPDPILG